VFRKGRRNVEGKLRYGPSSHKTCVIDGCDSEAETIRLRTSTGNITTVVMTLCLLRLVNTLANRCDSESIESRVTMDFSEFRVQKTDKFY
jgi:hypothetical protein